MSESELQTRKRRIDARLRAPQPALAYQPHFNIGAMRVKAFRLPPVAERHEIVRRVESLFALADQLEARRAAAQRQERAHSRAFSGKLFPQLPNDELACGLLEQIHKARTLKA